MCDCDIDVDNIFLLIMTAVAALMVAVDVKVLEKMFEEYFTLKHYLSDETYYGCYKPQAEMRMVLEGYAIYSAILCTVLMGALTVNCSEASLDKLLLQILNVTYILFGPLLFTICLYGFYNIKAIASVCGIRIIKGETNAAAVAMLVIFFVISLGVSATMVMEKLAEIRGVEAGETMLYKLSQMYFQYQQKL